MEHLKSSKALLKAAKMIETKKEDFICIALNNLCSDGKIQRHQASNVQSHDLPGVQ